MIPRADQYTLDSLKAQADIVDEVTELITYLGYFNPILDLSDAEKESTACCAVIMITQTAPDGTYPNKTKTAFAEGHFMYDQIWNNRATLNYKYKKF